MLAMRAAALVSCSGLLSPLKVARLNATFQTGPAPAPAPVPLLLMKEVAVLVAVTGTEFVVPHLRQQLSFLP